MKAENITQIERQSSLIEKNKYINNTEKTPNLVKNNNSEKSSSKSTVISHNYFC